MNLKDWNVKGAKIEQSLRGYWSCCSETTWRERVRGIERETESVSEEEKVREKKVERGGR